MSWNIQVYAEHRKDDSSEWEPVVDRCLFDHFKHYADEFYDSMCKISIQSLSLKSIGELLAEYESCDVRVKYCDLERFTDHYQQTVDKTLNSISSIYSALGLNFHYDGYECYSEDQIDNDTDDSSKCQLLRSMTYPVNKMMFHNLSTMIYKLNEANHMIGLSKTIYSLLDNFDDQVRLVFVTI